MANVRSITPNDPADFTPEVGNYKTLQPFRYWCQKVLPLVYDDSLSYYELLCKVVDYLNKTMEDVETLNGDVTNLHTAYEELQSYVNNYFSTLDVQEEINNKLDEMAQGGTLEIIIKNAFTNSRILNIKFLGRTYGVKNYPSAQGMCTRMINGILHIYTCYYNYENGNLQRSVIQDMLSDGTIIATSEPMPLNHSNDMCYNKNKNVFIVCGYNTNIVYEINADTLEMTTQYSLNNASIISITYDDIDDCYYTYNSSVIRKWNTDFTETEIVSRGAFSEDYGVETIEYKNGLLYITQNQPNTLTVISKHDWKMKTVIMIQDFASDYYPVGEMQSISIYNENGDFILSGKPRQYNPITGSTDVGSGLTMFATGNIYKNTTYVRRYYQASITPFVGNANINTNANNFKPNGAGDRPFTSFGELACCLDSPLYKPQTIYFDSDIDEDIILLDKKIAVQGGDHTVKSLSVYNFSGYINRIKCSGNINIIRAQGVLNAITTDGTFTIEQSNLGYKNIDISNCSISNSTLKNCDVKPETLTETLLDVTIEQNNQGISETLSKNVNLFSELTFVLMAPGNNRIIDIKTIDADKAKALYMCGYDGLTDQSHLYRSVFILTNATTVTIAGSAGRYVIYGK